MPGCDFVAEGNDDSEVMRQAEEHARRDHGMATIPPEVEQQARGAIRDIGR
jgi:predicted small metal-binding protein